MKSAVFSSRMVSICILALIIPTSFCQLALASSSYTNSPFKPSLGGRETRHTLTKIRNYPQKNPIPLGIESEIAAIFKGVAYGTSTSSSSTVEIPTISTTTTTTPKPTTETGSFIGQQKRVRINVDLVPDKFPFASSEKADVEEKEDINVSSNTAYSYPQKEIEEVDYETFKEKVLHLPKEKPVLKSITPKPIEVENHVKPYTEAPAKQHYKAIQFHIEKAWTIHTYITGCLFALFAVISLLLLTRINYCSQMFPRGYYVTLHLVIFVTCFFRALLFLHDPYGIHDKLPKVLIAFVYYTVYPCLNSAFAILLLAILRAARVQVFPAKVQSPILVAIICIIHTVSSLVVEITNELNSYNVAIIVLRIVVQSLGALFGAALCLIYVFSYNNVEKSAQRHGAGINHIAIRQSPEKFPFKKPNYRPSLKTASRMFMLCCLLNALLTAFFILDMCTQTVPQNPSSSESWAWLTQSSLERLIELMLASILIGTAQYLTKYKTTATGTDEKIFSLFKNFARTPGASKTMDVYPVVSEKCNILSNGSLISSSPTSSITGWKKTGNTMDSYCKTSDINCMTSQYNQILHTGTYGKINPYSSQTVGRNVISQPQYYSCKDQQQWEYPKDFQYYQPQHNDNSKSLPKRKADIQTPITENSTFNNKNIYPIYAHNDANISCNSRSPICRYENEYEVASYYSNSNNSTATNIYAKPYPYYTHCYNTSGVNGQYQQHIVPVFRHQDLSKNGNSACSSHSEIQVDYLTDASSEGMQSSLSRSHTLPMNVQNACDNINVEGVRPEISNVCYNNECSRPEVTDSRLVSSPLDLLKLSSTSLNDVLKCQSHFFGKIVNGGGNNTGYAPLSLEESTIPSSDINLRKHLTRSNSSGNIDNDSVGV